MELKFGKYLLKVLPFIYNYQLVSNQLIINIPADKFIPVFIFLKYHTNTQFKILSDLCVVDYPTRTKRFDVVYNLLSIKFNSRLCVKVSIDEYSTIPSLTNIYASSNWWEREAFDMFGVKFKNHPELRRILSDYGFEGNPLRKDFPLSGFSEVRYCEHAKRVIYEKINLAQESRDFNYDNSWK